MKNRLLKGLVHLGVKLSRIRNRKTADLYFRVISPALIALYDRPCALASQR